MRRRWPGSPEGRLIGRKTASSKEYEEEVSEGPFFPLDSIWYLPASFMSLRWICIKMPGLVYI
jgi:hypothetical protein